MVNYKGVKPTKFVFCAIVPIHPCITPIIRQKAHKTKILYNSPRKKFYLCYGGSAPVRGRVVRCQKYWLPCNTIFYVNDTRFSLIYQFSHIKFYGLKGGSPQCGPPPYGALCFKRALSRARQVLRTLDKAKPHQTVSHIQTTPRSPPLARARSKYRTFA